MKKVFCINCKYYDSGSSDYHDHCDHPLNFEPTYIDPMGKRELYPEDRNKKNSCTLFEPKMPLSEIFSIIALIGFWIMFSGVIAIAVCSWIGQLCQK